MPVRRRIDKRRQEVTDEQEAWLQGDDKASGFIQYAPNDELTTLWATHCERIVAERAALHPGTRPARWWQYQAVEPRRRLGGIGTPASDVLAYKPTYWCGLPSIWISQRQVKYYSGIAVDIRGSPIGGKLAIFKGVAIDPDHPPTFESQAAYLKRHGLFLAGEERQLKKADFDAETIAE
jgi:hypothetical protein